MMYITMHSLKELMITAAQRLRPFPLSDYLDSIDTFAEGRKLFSEPECNGSKCEGLPPTGYHRQMSNGVPASKPFRTVLFVAYAH